MPRCKSARVYVTSLGLYELHLNGQRVGDGVLTPGWTSYNNRLQYQTYDVTDLLVAGENAIGALLGDGWYRGWLGFEGNRNTYGDRLGLLLQLHVTYADGRTAVIASDGQWRATPGPIRMSDIYNGEAYDARLELPGWAAAGYDDRAWQGVRKLDHGKEMLVAQAGPLVKRQEELKPVKIIHTPSGRDGLRLRPEHGGLGAAEGPGAGGHDRSPCATPRCSTSRATSTSPTCARRSRPFNTR